MLVPFLSAAIRLAPDSLDHEMPGLLQLAVSVCSRITFVTAQCQFMAYDAVIS